MNRLLAFGAFRGNCFHVHSTTARPAAPADSWLAARLTSGDPPAAPLLPVSGRARARCVPGSRFLTATLQIPDMSREAACTNITKSADFHRTCKKRNEEKKILAPSPCPRLPRVDSMCVRLIADHSGQARRRHDRQIDDSRTWAI